MDNNGSENLSFSGENSFSSEKNVNYKSTEIINPSGFEANVENKKSFGSVSDAQSVRSKKDDNMLVGNYQNQDDVASFGNEYNQFEASDGRIESHWIQASKDILKDKNLSPSLKSDRYREIGDIYKEKRGYRKN